MPIYEYVCQECGERVEALQRIDDPPLTECPSCGGSLKKAISAPAFQFKGSGWYVTDYAGKGKGKERPGDPAAPAAPAAKGETKATDSASKADDSKKPATAAE